MGEPVEEVVASCTQPLLRAALGLGFAQTDAEELVQETFVTYLNGKFEGRSSVKTYLFGILYHKGSEFARRRRREQPTEDIEAAFDARFDARGLLHEGSRRDRQRRDLPGVGNLGRQPQSAAVPRSVEAARMP